jgi:hypothetical protein
MRSMLDGVLINNLRPKRRTLSLLAWTWWAAATAR